MVERLYNRIIRRIFASFSVFKSFILRITENNVPTLYTPPLTIEGHSMPRSIEYDSFGLIVHFEKASPLPATIFREHLAEEGFTPSEDVAISHEALQSQGPPEFVFDRDDVAVIYQPNDGEVVVLFGNPSATDVAKEINGLLGIVTQDIGVDNEDIEAMEVQIRANVWDGEDTRRHFKDLYDTSAITEIFEQETYPFSVRWVSEGAIDGVEVHDVRVEPFAQNTDYFFVELRYGEPDINSVIDFADNSDDNIDQILKSIEG